MSFVRGTSLLQYIFVFSVFRYCASDQCISVFFLNLLCDLFISEAFLCLCLGMAKSGTLITR